MLDHLTNFSEKFDQNDGESLGEWRVLLFTMEFRKRRSAGTGSTVRDESVGSELVEDIFKSIEI